MRRLAAAAWALWAVVAATAPAQAIVIDDATTPGYVTGAAAYTGVAKVTYNGIGQGGTTYICSGALLIDGLHVVTAGHCVQGGSNWLVTFETPGGTTTLAVT